VNYDLVISSQPSKVDIALLRDKQLIELHQETGNSGFQVGDLYYGRVQKVMPGLNAAFINVGYEKDGFLHYLDLGPQVRSLMKFIELIKGRQTEVAHAGSVPFGKPEIDKGGKVGDVAKQGQAKFSCRWPKSPSAPKAQAPNNRPCPSQGRYMVLGTICREGLHFSEDYRDNDEKTNALKTFSPR
jgi:ribonuclease G